MSDQIFKADLPALQSLSEELGYPEAVISPMQRAAASLPASLPVDALTRSDSAEGAWKQVTEFVPNWQEDDGMALLAATTAAACLTRRRYRELGIEDRIFLNTMKCIPRFLYESRELYGRWVYDRGFWTWRQTGCLLFHLGTLEFEYRKLEDIEPVPEGLRVGDPVISVHIPSDAHLNREALDDSYRRAEKFFSAGTINPWSEQPPRAILCESWLLAPTLDLLLPETSGIRIFSSYYTRYHEQTDSNAFYRWLYQLPSSVPYRDLPERTSLQRSLKKHLLSGGHMGMARGRLR